MKPSIINIATFTDELNNRLKEFEGSESETLLTQTGKLLSFSRALLKELKQFAVSYTFADKHEEVLFFKHQKPVLLSQHYYYKRKFAIQLFDAFRDQKSRLENYHRILNKMQTYIEKQKDFYEYYLSGSGSQDESYFTRHQQPIIKVNFDENFTTGYDERLSKILAIEMTKTYLLKCIDKLKDQRVNSINPEMNWTGQKIELVELIYALQAVGSFNNSTSDVRKIVEAFEIFFNVDLGNYYRTFVGLRMRKNGYTSFLDRMKEKLEQRISEIEEK